MEGLEPKPKRAEMEIIKTIRMFLKLSKFGIAFLVLLTTILGYFLAATEAEAALQTLLLWLIIGVYLTASGIFILNQAQEAGLDSRMERTKNRPIPRGQISVKKAFALGFSLSFLGLLILFFFVSTLSFCLALITCILYNFFYTLRWKKNFPVASVFLGALPGAMPVVIGFSARAESVLHIECWYLFLIMFLWQMPHFWSLAFRYKDDYAKAQIPVLPLYSSNERTFFYIGLYLLAYLGTALLAPFFLKTGVLYLALALPISIKLMMEYYYFYSKRKWFSFFSWLNLSLLFFLSIPLVDGWTLSLITTQITTQIIGG